MGLFPVLGVLLGAFAPMSVGVEVLDTNGDPIMGANVVASDEMGDIDGATGTTSAEGQCSINIPDDRANIRIDVSVPAGNTGQKRYKSKSKRLQGTSIMIVLEEEVSLGARVSRTATIRSAKAGHAR